MYFSFFFNVFFFASHPLSFSCPCSMMYVMNHMYPQEPTSPGGDEIPPNKGAGTHLCCVSL